MFQIYVKYIGIQYCMLPTRTICCGIVCYLHSKENKKRSCFFFFLRSRLNNSTSPCFNRSKKKNNNFAIMTASPIFFFFNWNSFHARLNSYYKAWSYKKKKHKIKAYRKSVQKEPTVKRCLLILDLKPFRSQENILQPQNFRVQLCEERNC